MNLMIRSGKRLAVMTAFSAMILGAVCLCIGVYELLVLPSEFRSRELIAGAILKLAGIGLGALLSVCIATITYGVAAASGTRERRD